jgi:hypothetical protein
MIVGFFIPLAIILYTSADVLYLLNKVSKPQTANRTPNITLRSYNYIVFIFMIYYL